MMQKEAFSGAISLVQKILKEAKSQNPQNNQLKSYSRNISQEFSLD